VAGRTRKRGGRTPRGIRQHPASMPVDSAGAREAGFGVLRGYLVVMLRLFAFSDLMPAGRARGGVISELDWHLATLFGTPCVLIPGAFRLMRSRPMLLAWWLGGVAVIGLSRWQTLITPPSSLHLGVRLLAGVVACGAITCHDLRGIGEKHEVLRQEVDP